MFAVQSSDLSSLLKFHIYHKSFTAALIVVLYGKISHCEENPNSTMSNESLTNGHSLTKCQI
jgi:hypothetical protein